MSGRAIVRFNEDINSPGFEVINWDYEQLAEPGTRDPLHPSWVICPETREYVWKFRFGVMVSQPCLYLTVDLSKSDGTTLKKMVRNNPSVSPQTELFDIRLSPVTANAVAGEYIKLNVLTEPQVPFTVHGINCPHSNPDPLLQQT